MKKIIMIIISLLLITGCSANEQKNNNSKVNNNENITKEQTIGDFKISNVSLISENGSSTLKITITNTTDHNVNINDFKVTFKSKSGSVITILNGFSIEDVEPNLGLDISLDSDIDLSKATSVEYEIN